MRRCPRAQLARSILLWSAVMLAPVVARSGSAAEPPVAVPYEEVTLDSSDPQSWPRFALNEARQIGIAIDHPHRHAQILEQIAIATTGIGEPGAARVLLEDATRAALGIRDPSLRDLALRDIGINQTRCDDVPGALRTLDHMESPELRDAVRSSIVNAQVDAKQLSAALSTARAIGNPTVMSDALRTIAIAHAQRERMGDARDIAQRVPDRLVRAMAVADIAALHADIGNAQALESARLIARNVVDARQRDVALSYVAGIQAQSGDVRGALSTSDTIKDGSSRAYALTRIANARMRMNDASLAQELLNRALAAARRTKPSTAAAAVLCEISQAFVLNGDKAQAGAALDAALAVATSGRKLRQNTATFETIARVRARAGDVAGALSTAERVPEGSAKALLIHDILAAQAEAGDVDAALLTARALSEPQLQVAAFFGIIGVQITSGLLPGARESMQQILELARETEDLGFRSHSLAALAAAQIDIGNRVAGWKSFEEALAAAAQLPDAYTRALAYVNLSDPFTQRR